MLRGTMNTMAARRGWEIDLSTLRPVATDSAALQAELGSARGEDRVFLLRLLGRLDEAFAEGDALLADPATKSDPWLALLTHADTCWLLGEFAAAEDLQLQAWHHARGRDRQASTLQHIGYRLANFGDLDAAAPYFELALTMRRGFADPEAVAESEQACTRLRELVHYDAIVLAGGSGERFGRRDKPSLRLADWPLLDHVLLAASTARTRIVVGPDRIALTDPVFCREDPPGSGPVAAIAAAMDRLTQPLVAVLAADVPFIGPGLDELRTAMVVDANDAAAYVDTTGRVNYLAAVWRVPVLRAALARIGDPTGAPVRALYDGIRTAKIPDFDALSADCDTPNDLAVAQQRITRRIRDRLPVTPLALPRLELHAPS